MKRMLSMILVVALLLSCVPAVFAAEDVGIEYVELSGLPETFTPGPATAPTVQVVEGQVTVTQVRWMLNEMEPATTLEADQIYYLAVTLTAKTGYYIEEWLDVKADYEPDYSTFDDNLEHVVYFRYSLLADAGEIKAYINEPYEGMDIADLTCTVEGNAVLESISVYDEKNGTMMEEGTFGPLNTYQITYTLQAKSGYEFLDHGDLEVNDGEKYVEWWGEGKELTFWAYFSTCQPIETVEMTLGEVTVGMAHSAVELTVDPDAPYEVSDVYVYDYSDSETGIFENGGNYELSFNLRAKEGYVFSQEVCGYINGEEVVFWASDSGSNANGWVDISFGVDYIGLSDLPYEIQPGEAELPEPWCNKQVSVTAVAWVDEAKQPVTAFQDGKVYYLAVSLEAKGTRCFGQEPEIGIDSTGTTTIFEKLDDKNAVVYIRYSLEPALEAVSVTVTGVEVGKPLDGVTITVDGNATFVEAVITEYIPQSEDSYYTQEPNSDVFEAGKIYSIECLLKPGEGYRFTHETEFTVNGESFGNWGERGELRMLGIIMDTCQKINTAKLTMGELKVGKAFSDLQVKVPAGANYTATTYWYDCTEDWTEATGKVQTGHRYEARVILEAKAGYVFAAGATATLNGDSFEIYSERPNCYAWGWLEKSFQTPITKVELPARPASIQKNKELPQLTVSSSKNYTLTCYWGLMGGDTMTEATEDGVYVLVYSAEPKKGYTFTDDTKFYIGGKAVRPLESGWNNAQFLFNYNIGIPEIDRVDLDCEEPQLGQRPPQVTVPDDAEYVLDGVMWLQGATSDWADAEFATILTAGLYTHVSGMVTANEGMALDENVAFYIGGQKLEPTVIYNFGQYAIALFSLGKLGEIEKLTAPQLSKDGAALSWNAVLNATDYEIYRATSKSGKYTKVATISDTTWTDDVTAGKTYYYKVKAVFAADSSKNSGYSGVVSIDYKCAEPVITVVNGSTGKPVVSWEKVSGAKKYTVYRATSETGKYTKLGTTTKLTYTDTKASVGTTCYYKVIANASSSKYSSGYSEIQSCYVICGTPAVTIKNDAASGKPILSWSKITGAVKYEVYLLGAEDYVTLGTVTGTSFKDESCYAGEGRYYGVRAIASNTLCDSEVSDAIFGRANCAQPKLKGSIDSMGLPSITWEPIEGAVSYEVYRSTKSTKGYKLLKEVETASYTDETVAPGKTYYYKVVAIGENCKSAESAYVKLTGKCATPELFVENAASGKPYLKWYKVTGAKKYTVYRATSENGKYSKLGTTTKIEYIDTKAASGGTYFYKIVANASSSKYSSGYSNIVSCGVTCAAPTLKVTNNAAGKPVVSWSKVTGAVKYKITYQFGYLGGGEPSIYEVYTTQTSYTFDDLTADMFGWVEVTAIAANEAYNSQPAEVEAEAIPATPKITVKLGAGGKPVITWTDNGDAVIYEIYRSTKKSSGFKLIGEVDCMDEFEEFVPEYEDTTAAKGKTYYYKVIARSWNSKSKASDPVKIKSK